MRLVGGDPLTADAVVAETLAVAAAGVPFDVVPGVATGTAVPAYAGVPLGSAHVEADVRAGVDWAALAASPARSCCTPPRRTCPTSSPGLTEHGLAADDAGRRDLPRHADRAEDRADHARGAARARARTSTARWS